MHLSALPYRLAAVDVSFYATPSSVVTGDDAAAVASDFHQSLLSAALRSVPPPHPSLYAVTATNVQGAEAFNEEATAAGTVPIYCVPPTHVADTTIVGGGALLAVSLRFVAQGNEQQETIVTSTVLLDEHFVSILREVQQQQKEEDNDYNAYLSSVATRAQKHPFCYVPLPPTTGTTAHLRHQLQTILASAVYQVVFSANVKFVQESIGAAVDKERSKRGGGGATAGAADEYASVTIPLSAFGPALLLATRVCCCSAPVAAPTSTDDGALAASTCLGGCGNKPHDLLSRAFLNARGKGKESKNRIVAVQIPLQTHSSASQSCNERDYLFGVVHSGHENNDDCPLSIAFDDFHGKAAKSKGYALQTHIKGLNFIMRMATRDLATPARPAAGQHSAEEVLLPRREYQLGCAAFATAALASRESSTHANQFIPAGGIRLLRPRALFSVLKEIDARQPKVSSSTCEDGSSFVLGTSHPPLSVTRGGHTGISTGASSASANPLAQKALCFDVIGRLVELTAEGERMVNNAAAADGNAEERMVVGKDERHDVSGDSTTPKTTFQKRSLSTMDFVRPFSLKQNIQKSSELATPTAHTPLSLRDIANAQFTAPVILVTGTSAEAGKSTFAKKVMTALQSVTKDAWRSRRAAPSATHVTVDCLSPNPPPQTSDASSLRVAYVKATGTSSWGDTIQALRLGINAAYDQLDCGLPTTYAKNNVDELDQLAQLSLSFLHAQSDGADVIVAELGGDIIFAKNPELITQQWLWKNVFKCFVLANDSLSAIGVVHYLGLSGSVTFEAFERNQKSCASASSTYSSIIADNVPFPLQFVASPFRTFDGAVSRANMLSLPSMMSPNISKGDLIEYFLQPHDVLSSTDSP